MDIHLFNSIPTKLKIMQQKVSNQTFFESDTSEATVGESKTTNSDKPLSSDQVLNFLSKTAINEAIISFKQIDKETHMSKEEILAMGFTEEEFSQYFYSTQVQVLNENGEYVLPDNVKDTFAVKSGVSINGRTVNSLEDLKYELFQAPINDLYNKVKAGVISNSQIVEELEKMGATDISETPIENDPLGRTTLTFTYRGETHTIIPQNLQAVEEPKEQYDENGEEFIRTFDDSPIDYRSLASLGFADSEIEKYFDIITKEKADTKHSQYRTNPKDDHYYILKTGIKINGFEIKSINELQYFVVFGRLKNENN